jgi:hypothetical protein
MNRIETAERTAKGKTNFSENCICFPEEEQPFFCDPSEEEVAAKAKCPLHGDRFKQPIFHVYVPWWRRESESVRRERLSAQYRKAWEVTFRCQSEL